tara:strand:+ start:88497 stop:89033 length:537 start_codon:yes stop_codon:yes gene_type:complete
MTTRLLKFFTLIALLTTYACSSTAPVTDAVESPSNSIQPAWYASAESAYDSVAYYGFGTAIASDSSLAIEKAEMQAKIRLEKLVDETSEEIRNDLVDEGSTDADNTDFIIILRKATTLIRTAASTENAVAVKVDGNYRAFAKAGITKTQIRSTLEKGFTGHPRYWGGFSGADSFAANF